MDQTSSSAFPQALREGIVPTIATLHDAWEPNTLIDFEQPLESLTEQELEQRVAGVMQASTDSPEVILKNLQAWRRKYLLGLQARNSQTDLERIRNTVEAIRAKARLLYLQQDAVRTIKGSQAGGRVQQKQPQHKTPLFGLPIGRGALGLVQKNRAKLQKFANTAGQEMLEECTSPPKQQQQQCPLHQRQQRPLQHHPLQQQQAQQRVRANRLQFHHAPGNAQHNVIQERPDMAAAAAAAAAGRGGGGSSGGGAVWRAAAAAADAAVIAETAAGEDTNATLANAPAGTNPAARTAAAAAAAQAAAAVAEACAAAARAATAAKAAAAAVAAAGFA